MFSLSVAFFQIKYYSAFSAQSNPCWVVTVILKKQVGGLLCLWNSYVDISENLLETYLDSCLIAGVGCSNFSLAVLLHNYLPSLQQY